ncbi:MAG: NAD-dependent epimerase/dehydratase family protein [Candidatus Zixiibacteriota bacterium]
MSRVLVTGGAGFIGSHLVDALVGKGHEVTVFDNFSTGREENLSSSLSKVKVIREDILNLQALSQAATGTNLIYHLAAISSVPLSVDNPTETFQVNLIGTSNVLEAARRSGIKRVVFISSASVYGADAPVPFRETLPLEGSSPYATSKLIGEQLCNLYRRLYGLETVALRLFSVYGPRQNPRSQYANVIPAFSTRLLRGEAPVIYGTGKQTRDFIFVGDVVKALWVAGRKNGINGEVINFGSGRQTTVLQLLALISKSLRIDIPPQFAPAKPGDDPRTCADTRKARRVLGIEKLTPLESGLKKTCTWFRQLHEAGS